MISLMVFLGNPGSRYSRTRHNAGRMVLQHLSDQAKIRWQSKFHGAYARYTPPQAAHAFRLLIPHTYMNKSGESVVAAAQFFKLHPEEILVVHDDIESAFGDVLYKEGGGLAGHNGLKSIATALGSRDFARLKIGISRPTHGAVSNYVLARFSPEEEAELPDILRKAAHEIETMDP